jgi:CRP-like cAMP-binding protein
VHATGQPAEADRLIQAPFLAALDERHVVALAECSSTLRHPRGTRVLSRGDHLDGLFVVLSGKLKLFMLSCNGDERVLRVLQPGDSFGEAIMFNRIPSPVFVDTLMHSELAFLPSEAITDTLQRDQNFVLEMLRNMSGLMAALVGDLETACMQNALQRTVNYLLREALNTPPPHMALTMPAPKAVIASTLNLSAETFSRELHRLQDHGMIEIDRRVVYLRDRDGLKRLADGARLD